MSDQPVGTPVQRRKRGAPKFYRISWSNRHGLADFEVENEAALRMGALALFPPRGQRGFPAYPEKPRVVIGKRRKGPPPSDIELYHSYWLVSDRLKQLFEAVDPEGVTFQACDVLARDGALGPVYWLCDVVRVLDPFGEPTRQRIRLRREKTGYTVFPMAGTRDLVFDETAVGSAHIFRTPYSPSDVFCDQLMKDTCKDAGMKGVMFGKANHKR